MMKFIGRKEELKVLENAYQSKTSAFIPIYGRRRVGKSELILRFLKGKTGVYFAGKRAQPGLQMQEFLRESAVALKEPLLAGYTVSDWSSVLSAVVDRWRRNEKLIIIFDEFQWTAQASPELPSVLQAAWDRHWKNSGKVMLILCGSYVGFMERDVLGRQSPLFGRRTAQIFLKPFSYLEAANFHPAYSLADRARTYFVCGGIPLYLNFFNTGRSVEINIVENLLNQYAPLYQEPDFLLREELRDVNNYYAILMAVASGYTSHINISKQTGIDNRALHYYLKQLMELGYLSRRYPLTGSRPASRHVRYLLEDPLLRFWFRFIYPNTSYILQLGGVKSMKDRVGPYLESFFGSCFERLCREALPLIYREGGVNASFNVGEYWDRNVQIGVIGIRDDNWIDMGECKWGSIRSAKAVEKELMTKVTLYPNPQNATISGHIFTRNPVRKKNDLASDIRWHSLKNIYGLNS